jgi:hypothetical protein
MVKSPVEDGSFSMSMTAEEMLSLVQILSFSAQIFEEMGKNLLAEGNKSAASVYASRCQLSLALYDKLSVVAGIGEPSSREVH